MGKYWPPKTEEIHSLGIGFMDGMGHKRIYSSLETAKGQIPDVKKEPHYYRLGYWISNNAKISIGGVAVWEILII